MALTYPEVTSMKQGLACPAFGDSPTDFVTTAPAPFSSMRTMDGPVSSMMPDATMPGLSRMTPPTSVFNDTMGLSTLSGYKNGAMDGFINIRLG